MTTLPKLPHTTLVEYLGADKHGFRHYRAEDRYVYQQYPTDRDYWDNGTNRRGQMNGWLCSVTTWEDGFNKTVVSK